MQKFFIDGPAGKIETILAEPAIYPRGIAVIAHPHPLHGGTMNNKVVYTLFNSVLELGFIAVKFNFRGVGNSEGVFGHGVGEVEDAVTVTQAIQRQYYPQWHDLPLLLAGFSFGGGVQVHAADRLIPESIILVAPSLKLTEMPVIHKKVEHTLVIHGDQDKIVPLNSILKWATPQSLPVIIIPGAEHFFHGKLTILKRAIQNFLKA